MDTCIEYLKNKNITRELDWLCQSDDNGDIGTFFFEEIVLVLINIFTFLFAIRTIQKLRQKLHLVLKFNEDLVGEEKDN